jgi:hypothetical protein
MIPRICAAQSEDFLFAFHFGMVLQMYGKNARKILGQHLRSFKYVFTPAPAPPRST